MADENINIEITDNEPIEINIDDSQPININIDGNASAPAMFLDLTDVPSSYSGQSGKLVQVKSTEDGLEFTNSPTVVDWDEISGEQSDIDLSGFTDDIGITSHISNTSNPHSVTKTQVGLGNVDNTSDLNKPISTATQSALDGKQPVGNYFNKTTDDTDDITDTEDNRFTNDTDIARLANTSGTNTGDVSVLDSNEIDFTLSGQQITASLKSGSIDETKLDTSVNASLDLADSSIQTELDPVFTAHPAYSLTSQDLTDIGNLSGTNTGDQDLSGLVPYTGATSDVDLGFHSLKLSSNVTLNYNDAETYNLSSGQGGGQSFGGDTTNAYIQSWSSRPLYLNRAGNVVKIGSAGLTSDGGVDITGGLTLTGDERQIHWATTSWGDKTYIKSTDRLYIQTDQNRSPRIIEYGNDNGKLEFGSTEGVVNIYRQNNNELKTDNNFVAVGTITGSNLSGTNTGDQESSDFSLADLSDVDKTNKATGKIIQVKSDGNHEYVDLPNPDLSGYAQLSGATFTGDVSANNLSGTNTGDNANRTETLTAGENLVSGNVCYLKSDGKYWKAKADAESTTKGRIVLCTATISADATGTFLIKGNYTDSSLTVGATYYLSVSTAGAKVSTIPSTSGNQIRVLGQATSTTNFYFNPSQDYGEVA